MGRVDLRLRVAAIRDAAKYEDFIEGTRQRFLCPAHADKKPSASVKAGKWRCWSCDARGDIIDFVAHRDGLKFNEAVAHLESLYGLNPLAEPVEVVERRDRKRQAKREAINKARALVELELMLVDELVFSRGRSLAILRNSVGTNDWHKASEGYQAALHEAEILENRLAGLNGLR